MVQIEKLKKRSALCNLKGHLRGYQLLSPSLSRADFEWEKRRQQCLQSNTGDANAGLHTRDDVIQPIRYLVVCAGAGGVRG